MSALLQQAFRTASSELGMASAAWLFVQEAAAAEGDAGVAAMRDELGRLWPVLDAVCAGWLDGIHGAQIQSSELLADLAGTTRLVVVGIESLWLDHLIAQLPSSMQVGLVQQGDPVTYWPRVVSNYGERVRLLQLADFQSWAGPRSALLTFVYGQAHDQVFVLPGWLRVCGTDVRMQFRALLGWRVLDAPMEVYPRWLVATSVDTLTALRPCAW